MMKLRGGEGRPRVAARACVGVLAHVGMVLGWTASGRAQDDSEVLSIAAGFSSSEELDDDREIILTGGVKLRHEASRAELRAESAVIVVDRDSFVDLVRRTRSRTGLPRRGAPWPRPRRPRPEDVLRARLRGLLAATGRPGSPPGAERRRLEVPFGLVRHVYLEGDVTLVRGDTVVLHAKSLFFSAEEDRLAAHDFLLRLLAPGQDGEPMTVVLRGARIVREERRIVGRDLSLTTCTAGEPHFEVIAGEAEIIERRNRFEVRTRSSCLAVSGVRILPLLDLTFFTGEQTDIPVRSVSLGNSSREGVKARVELGSSWNDLGGPIHHFLTGRPAEEFTGDWSLRTGYIQERGQPVEGRLAYRGGDLYFGRTSLFWLDDRGRDIREIRNRLDASPITNRNRNLVATENRIFLGANTNLDLTLFHASDAGVYSEFFPAEYRTRELPETSAHLRSAAGNRVFTATARVNTTGFAYADDRSLAPRFVEELPLLTFDVFSQPLAELPLGGALLLTSSSTAGYLRHDDDRTAGPLPADATFRIDQELELSAPFLAGPIGVRPFVSGRVTYYDRTLSRRSRARTALAMGVRAGTWLGRTWRWGEGAQTQAVRHVISPYLTVLDRFLVDDRPGGLPRFDEVDVLDERFEVRIGVLNRLLHRPRPEAPVTRAVWLDLAQTFFPTADRDNAGDTLGLFEYELIVRPSTWVPVPGLQLVVEGEHDWNLGDERTFNTELAMGPVLGLNWFVDYRTDRAVDGAIGYGASTRFLGRWQLLGAGQYDLERKEVLSYTVQVARYDHDWRIWLGMTFDVVDDSQTVFFAFEPTLGGLILPREVRYSRDRRFWEDRGFAY